MRSLLLILSLTLLLAQEVMGQIYSNQYRPPGLEWRELQTDRFRIVFPAKAADDALRAAAILETHYPHIRERIGGNLHRFPVILNTESDNANGFVTPLNFRSEVELTPSRSKSMNPHSGDWLNLVLPHELVHALHMSVNPGGVTWLTGLLSPDLRRSIHTAAPVGVFEGVAVHYESHGPGMRGGRGNHPFFVNRFREELLAGSPWSMGQLFHRSAASRPFDRHYAGSWEFIDWMDKQYGEDAIREAIRFHYRWPFLGLGVALRSETGEWPGRLYRRFIRDRERAVGPELQSSHTPDPAWTVGQKIDPGLKGPSMRRPLWLDGNRLLIHGSFYNAPTGFWIYHIDSGRMNLMHESGSTDDYRFALSRDGRTLHYADLVTDPRYDGVFRTRLHSVDLETGRTTVLKRPDRLYAPDPGTPFLALQTAGTAGRLIVLDPEEGTLQSTPIEPGPGVSVTEVQKHPLHRDLIAVIVRRGSQQALWIGQTDRLEGILAEEPEISFDGGSIYDLAWHPEEQRLLFTSDRTGVMEIYEYQSERSLLRQITRSRSNAFEASFSPDGDRIAYIVQEGSYYLPMLLEREDFLNREIPPEIWRGDRLSAGPDAPLTDAAPGLYMENGVPGITPRGLYEGSPASGATGSASGAISGLYHENTASGSPTSPPVAPSPGTTGTPGESDDPERREVTIGSARDHQSTPYRSGLSWIKPRTLLPLYRHRPDNGHQLGLQLHSTDLLARNTYRAEISHLYDQYWFDLDYTWTGVHPGVKTTLFSRPGTLSLRGVNGSSESTRLLQRNTGAGVEIPWRYLIESRTRFSSLEVNPGYRLSRLSLQPLRADGSSPVESDWLHTVSLDLVFNYRLRQQIRDVQPNAGWILFAQSHLDLNRFALRTTLNSTPLTRTLSGRRGVRAGLTTWLAPAARWNQSLRLDLQLLSQSTPGPWSSDQLISTLFHDIPFADSNRLGLFNTRYTIPFLYPDDGGLTVPAYLSTLYLVVFSQTVADLHRSRFIMQQNRMRTAIGAGVRARIRLSNLNLDLGLGVGYEPSRRQWRLLLSPF